jgi:hypothetical protein
MDAFAFLRALERDPLMAFIKRQVYQFFCDESGKYQKNPLTTFCGVLASEDRLKKFDRAWEDLLQSYDLDALHMKEASRLLESSGSRLLKGQTLDERTDLLIPFADCINEHLNRGFLIAADVRGYNSLNWTVKQALGGSHDPYFLSFIVGMMELRKHISEDDRIALIADDDIDTAWDLYLHYRAVGKPYYEVQRAMVSLAFANDRLFPALQAADMIAFLTRYQAEEDFYKVPNIWKRLFTRLMTEPPPTVGLMRWFYCPITEQLWCDFAQNFESARQAKEQEKNEKRGIRQIQQDNAATPDSSAQRDQSEVGSGEVSETEKAEG